ncbi:hypothetical protein DNU06_15845 [Putridiphycobacter roseus]|uniref:Carboxypeptidase-like regulatory domain-containing protein n=1 Tax=Putridiphycobacter roseus TaxID=2219161 RepID=A0A2W1NJR0_9FLAO|nr:carboxypeptidase-like regulatory domain-containing protein [Putridiphycobacter roseus]PZE15852.1 hypothetical protein DNU06_15845 [Putridiphycobacter roseus]
MKYLILILFSLTFLSGIGQNQIIDSESKEPVSYAYIKSINKLKGVISDYNGFFVLDSSFRALDSIIISCIGYNNGHFAVRDIIKNKAVELNPSTQNLSEVMVTAKKMKYQRKNLGITKKPKKTRFPDYVSTGKNGEEKATWIPNEYSVPGYLKNINVYVSDLGYPDAYFRIHVYACNEFETKPDKELTKSNIIASATTGNEWVTIDMSNEHIQVGENGCFIGIEWFDSPKSKFHLDTIFNNGQTWDENKSEYKDTIYSRIRKGNGAVLGAIYQKYRHSRNKHWQNNSDGQMYSYLMDSIMYTTATFPDGNTYLRTPDNSYQGVMCINIDVSFPKNKIDLTYNEPKKRKLNKLEKVKQNLFKYPQNNIHELFASLIKAFENDDIVYVLKYLCVYKEDQLNQILSEFVDEENEDYISDEEKDTIVKNLSLFKSKFDSAVLTKIDDKHFQLSVDNEIYNIIIDDGLWKINPYGYSIYK